jgi:hypothetical protein
VVVAQPLLLLLLPAPLLPLPLLRPQLLWGSPGPQQDQPTAAAALLVLLLLVVSP